MIITNRITQIIPASDGWYAQYIDEDGRKYMERVAVWALWEQLKKDGNDEGTK